MTETAAKVRENRLRRMAERQGMMLQKSRRRDPRSVDYGSYWLVESERNVVVTGGRSGTSLDDIEEYLSFTPRERAAIR